MSINDLTADMLTRIRNAVRNREHSVTCISNKLNRGVAQVLVDEGYVHEFENIDDGRQGLIRIKLEYGPRGEQVINNIDRVSKCGCRVYSGGKDLPRVLSISSATYGLRSRSPHIQRVSLRRQWLEHP